MGEWLESQTELFYVNEINFSGSYFFITSVAESETTYGTTTKIDETAFHTHSGKESSYFSESFGLYSEMIKLNLTQGEIF